MNKRKTVEYLFVFVGFVVVVVVALGALGTLTSGYHLIDDHNFYTLMAALEQDNFWNVVKDRIWFDFEERFRPLYWFLRILGVSLWGADALPWSLAKVLEIAGAMTCLYVSARKLDVSKLFAIFFAMLVLLGEQSVIFWRLGPQESVGILLFGIALLATIYLSEKPSLIRKIFFVLTMITLTLQKESFCLSMPSLFLLLFSLEIRNDEKKRRFVQSIFIFFQKHWLEIILLMSCFLIEIGFILFYVGTNDIGYAGFPADMHMREYLIAIVEQLRNPYAYMPYVLLMIGSVLFVAIEWKKNFICQADVIEIVFCFFLFVSQLIFHAKSGITGRYLIPGIIGACYLVCITGYRFIVGNRRLVRSVCGMLLVFLCFFVSFFYVNAIDFTQRGEDLAACVRFVTENAEKDMRVLGITRDEELDYSFNIYMTLEYGFTDCGEIVRYEDQLAEMEKADVLFGKSGQVHYGIKRELGVPFDNYMVFETPTYEVAIKKR